jgi:hypothetical protein
MRGRYFEVTLRQAKPVACYLRETRSNRSDSEVEQELIIDRVRQSSNRHRSRPQTWCRSETQCRTQGLRHAPASKADLAPVVAA